VSTPSSHFRGMPHDLPSLIAEIRRLVRFGTVGLAATATFVAISWALVRFGETSIVFANAAAYVVSATVSYLGHLHFTFGVAVDHRQQLSRFLIVAGVSFCLTLLVTWVVTHPLGAPHWVSIVAVIALIPIVNYVLNRQWVFVHRRHPVEAVAPEPEA